MTNYIRYDRYGRIVPFVTTIQQRTSHLNVVRGDVLIIRYVVYDTNGLPVDLTGRTVRMTLRKEHDSSIIFQKTIDWNDPDNKPKDGIIVFKLNHEDTNQYPDQYVFSVVILGPNDEYHTAFLGTLNIIKSTYW